MLECWLKGLSNTCSLVLNGKNFLHEVIIKNIDIKIFSVRKCIGKIEKNN